MDACVQRGAKCQSPAMFCKMRGDLIECATQCWLLVLCLGSSGLLSHAHVTHGRRYVRVVNVLCEAVIFGASSTW